MTKQYKLIINKGDKTEQNVIMTEVGGVVRTPETIDSSAIDLNILKMSLANRTTNIKDYVYVMTHIGLPYDELIDMWSSYNVLNGTHILTEIEEIEPEIDTDKWVEVINGWVRDNLFATLQFSYTDETLKFWEQSHGTITISNHSFIKHLCRRALAEEFVIEGRLAHVIDNYGNDFTDFTDYDGDVLNATFVDKSRVKEYVEICNHLNLFEL